MERDKQHQRQQQHHARRVDIALVLGVQLLPADTFNNSRQQQADDAAAVQRRKGQQIHDRQVDGDERPQVQHIADPVGDGFGGVARVRDDLDDTDRAAHILQAHRTGHQIVQAQLHQLDKIQAVVPGHFQKAPRRFFLRGKLHPVELDLLAIYRKGLLFHRELGELDGLPVPAELQVKFPRCVAGKQHGNIGVDIDPLAVDLIEFIPGLQAVLGFQARKPSSKSAITGVEKPSAELEQDERDEKARQEIHKRPGGENHRAGRQVLARVKARGLSLSSSSPSMAQ